MKKKNIPAIFLEMKPLSFGLILKNTVFFQKMLDKCLLVVVKPGMTIAMRLKDCIDHYATGYPQYCLIKTSYGSYTRGLFIIVGQIGGYART